MEPITAQELAAKGMTIVTNAYLEELQDKAQKWDNGTLDHRIVYIACKTEEQWAQFVKDAEIGYQIRELRDALREVFNG